MNRYDIVDSADCQKQSIFFGDSQRAVHSEDTTLSIVTSGSKSNSLDDTQNPKVQLDSSPINRENTHTGHSFNRSASTFTICQNATKATLDRGEDWQADRPKPEPPTRTKGDIATYSSASKKKSMDFLHSIDNRFFKTAFISTLTFEDDNVPDDNATSQNDVAKYAKRLEYHFGDDKVLINWYREMLPRESGEHTGELIPHYHLIVFHNRTDNLPELQQGIAKLWPARIKYVQHIRSRSGVINYLTKYVTKGDKSNTDLPEKWRGRFWGVYGRKHTEHYEAVEITKPVQDNNDAKIARIGVKLAQFKRKDGKRISPVSKYAKANRKFTFFCKYPHTLQRIQSIYCDALPPEPPKSIHSDSKRPCKAWQLIAKRHTPEQADSYCELRRGGMPASEALLYIAGGYVVDFS